MLVWPSWPSSSAGPQFREIDLERSIILEELREDYDERGFETHGEDIARGLLFGDHPLGQRVIGTEANVRRFGEDDLRRHHAKCYCAANMVVCIAGPVLPDRVFEAARRHLGALPRGERNRRGGSELRPGSGAVSLQPIAPARKPDVHIVFRAVPDMDPEYMASVALLRAIDDGMSTPLHYELCDRRGLAYSVGAMIEPLADVALLEVGCSAGQANISDLLSGAPGAFGSVSRRAGYRR